jgi:hypothetical protein
MNVSRIPRLAALGLGLAFLGGTACTPPPLPPGPQPDPASEPAEPQEPPADGRLRLNTEYYLGTRELERAQFDRFGQQIQALQERAAREHSQPLQRGFHAKAHGCLWGYLQPMKERPERARFGVLAADPPSPHPVWVRFSNGVGWRGSDHDLDARGMAIKVMGVAGKKYLDDEKNTQDFLMTNSPTPVGRDAVEFMKFAHANAGGRLAGILFLLGHPRTAGPALTRTGEVASMATETYWSGGAYHLGAHQTIKYLARPCDALSKRAPSRKGDDYLSRDLKAAAAQGLCFTFALQFQADPIRTPVENASREWTEKDAPAVPVARIVMPQKIDSAAELEFCRQLSFTPWHSVAAHKPMGHINRARRYVYYASKSKRQGGHEPSGFEGFDR